MSDPRMFGTGSPFSTESSPGPRNSVHYDIDVEAAHPESSGSVSPAQETQESEQSGRNGAPVLRHRKSRTNTVWSTYPAVVGNPHRPQWEPGQEPGLDPAKPYGGREEPPSLYTQCDITVVDYSEDDMVMRHLDNATLPNWIAKMEKMEQEGQKEDWVMCRWINVNGLSWDVIQALGKYKRLHRLAIEDMVNTKNRTKVDWYSDHLFIIMTLQKLVKLPLESDSESDSEDSSSSYAGVKRKKSWLSKLSDVLFHRNLPYHRRKRQLTEIAHSQDGIMSTHPCSKPSLPQPRTLQRYHGGPNIERMSFMEEHSAMTRKNLAVCAEQVSIFLTADNTVISFFETSAEDIETPILKRLATPETILRRSCDASMLTQAIIDAIIDLAMPISTTYSEIIQELELDVLTEPSINHTRELYILTSETTTMRNFISPIATLVRALRDHAGEKSLNAENPDKNGSGRAPGAGAAGLEISPTTHVYLSDVEDHTLLILSVLEQISASASGLISLIFNTISAYQSETMRQLTAATILFLPMTFITGYYGMNLQNLHGLDRDDAYFWSIALPVIFGTVLCLIWGGVGRKFGGWWKKLGRRRRRHSRERRERREEREMEKREKEKKEKKEQNEVSKRK